MGTFDRLRRALTGSHGLTGSNRWAGRRNRRKQRRRFATGRTSFCEQLEGRQLLAADLAGGVFHDLNADGIRDQGEDGLTGWTVYVDLDRSGTLNAGEPSAVTDADGQYRIANIPAGNYRVAEVLRTGWTATSPMGGFSEVTARDNETTRVDFLNDGTAGTAIIRGNVWRDLGNDGMRDPGDTGVAGWTVYLDLNTDRTPDPDEPQAITDGNGDYEFRDILGGGVGDATDYEVVEVLTPGWEAAPGYSDNYTVSVIEGQTTTVHDFANSPTEVSSITGVVWNDLNGNGTRDLSEPGLAGWTIFADRNRNGVADADEPQTTTGTTGGYSLLGLEAGTHQITELVPANFRATAPASGTRSVVAPASGTVGHVDFGNQLRTDAALGGVVYVDRDTDGVRGPGEEGLPGITVYLDDDNDGQLDPGELSTTTSFDLFYTPSVDESGSYRFDHLPGGTYVVRQIIKPELESTPEVEREHIVTVGPTEERSDIDSADRYRPGEIHGLKFEDTNGNHTRDSGEPGIEGVTIYIDLDRDNMFDPGEPFTVTAADGTYSFVDLSTDAYVLRELSSPGFVQTFPETVGGTLWPAGVSNASVGAVTPSSIKTSLAEGNVFTQQVSLTLPTSGALTNMVDVFFLFDDTGSFRFNSPIVRAAFPNIISQLQSRLTGIDLGFGVGRFEEYGQFAMEHSTGRPFILNQPVVASDVPEFTLAIQSALDRETPGYGGDRPETVIEALYQVVTGAGFDGNNNGSQLESGPAGLAATQVTPGGSGDVPPFASFSPDPVHGVLPASGSVGGAGFRSGALPIIITATDTGFAYQPKGDTAITGLGGATLPRSQVVATGRGTTPFNSGAGIQETITGLNALGALVIGLGTNAAATSNSRQGLEALATLTGATNRTASSIANGTTDPIDPGDPFYFQIGSGGTPLVLNIADGIVAAIEGAVTAVSVDVTVRASDPRVDLVASPGVVHNLRAGDTATFDVTFTGDGRPYRFDLEFVREGTDVVLGSIPVVLGTPIPGDGYEFEDVEDGEHSIDIDFGNHRIAGNLAPIANDDTYATDEDVPLTVTAAGVLTNDSDPDGDAIYASLATGPASGTVSLNADGSFTYTPNLGFNGTDSFTYIANDGALDSAPATVAITVNPVNDAPIAQ